MAYPSRLARWLRVLAVTIAPLALGLALSAPPLSPVRAAGVVLNETGSTLLYPLFQAWIGDYPQSRRA